MAKYIMPSVIVENLKSIRKATTDIEFNLMYKEIEHAIPDISIRMETINNELRQLLNNVINIGG